MSSDDARSRTEKPADAKLLVLSGPSGSGKTTIVQRLLKDSPVPLRKCVSATTRPPRTGEIDGEHYHFLSADEFERRREAGEFLETAEVFSSGYWYGTLKSEVGRAADEGAWAFLEIDVEGALNVMQEYPEAVTIFIRTSSVDEYEKRLRVRGTESEEVIQKRLATARRELAQADRYKYQVVNDDLDRAVDEIQHILRTEEAG
jgi:guanylate kinase